MAQEKKNLDREVGKEVPEQSEYVPPKITTYTEEQLIEQIGPAQACSGAPCPPGF